MTSSSSSSFPPSYPALELPDVHKVQSLFVVPSSRNSTLFVSSSYSSPQQRLAPIEMAAQSIHLSSPASTSPFVLGSKKAGGTRDLEAGIAGGNNSSGSSSSRARPGEDDGLSSSGCCHDFSSSSSSSSPAVSGAVKPWVLSVGLIVPLGYTCCGLALCLCHLMTPGYLHPCTLLISPLWTLALALHAVGMHDLVWLWLGLLTVLLLPFTLLVSDLLFVAFYLGVFAIFASGRFWQNLRGVPFLMVSLCWFGLASSLALSAVLQDQPVAQLAVATFFALAAGIVSASQLSKITIAFR